MSEAKYLRCEKCKVPFTFILRISVASWVTGEMQDRAEDYINSFIKNAPKMNCPVCGSRLQYATREPDRTENWETIKWKKCPKP